MQALRLLLARRRLWLAALLALTVAARLAVPAGFMPTVKNGTAVLSLCPAAGPSAAMPGMHHGHHYSGGDRHDAACPFGALAAAPLGAVDVPLLAAALLVAFVAALYVVVAVPPAPPARLRPPLRAPPTLA